MRQRGAEKLGQPWNEAKGRFSPWLVQPGCAWRCAALCGGCGGGVEHGAKLLGWLYSLYGALAQWGPTGRQDRLCQIHSLSLCSRTDVPTYVCTCMRFRLQWRENYISRYGRMYVSMYIRSRNQVSRLGCQLLKVSIYPELMPKAMTREFFF